jgi:subtilisin-like proprotein convertase family protein
MTRLVLMSLLVAACGGGGSATPDAMPAVIDATPSPDAARHAVDAAPAADADPAGERACADGVDGDGDGAIDCADPDCAARAACSLTCPAGHTRVIQVAASPHGFTQTEDAIVELTPGGEGVISTLAVDVDLTYEHVGSLVVSLETPAGSVRLLGGQGGRLADLVGTTFDDLAPRASVDHLPPYPGAYRPREPLVAVLGQPAATTLALRVHHYAPGPADPLAGTLEAATLVACTCQGCEAVACQDGQDSDGDELVDCADPDCAGDRRCTPEAACGDGHDEDLDASTDCADPDCTGQGTCEPAGELSCADGRDNDADGQLDCADPGCQAAALCRAEAQCRGAGDDDGDSLADCADPGCRRTGACEPDERTCNDGQDNDVDGTSDCADADCAAACLLLEPPTFRLVNCDPPLLLVRAPAGGLPTTTVDGGVRTLAARLDRVGRPTAMALLLTASHPRIGELFLAVTDPLAARRQELFRDLPPFEGAGVFDGAILGPIGWHGINDRPLFFESASPYAGTYASSLSSDGSQAHGDWRIELGDDTLGQTGSIAQAELLFCLQP